MDWTIETLNVLMTGVLFAGIVGAGLTPFVSLTPMSFGVFGAAGAVFIGSAFVLARVQAVNYPPVMWVLPILPLLVIGVLLTDAVSARRAPRRPERATAIARPDDERPLAASIGSPVHQARENDQGGEGAERERAQSPFATPNELAHMAINVPHVRPLIARNPHTPASVLQWLAQQREPSAVEALDARGLTRSAT